MKMISSTSITSTSGTTLISARVVLTLRPREPRAGTISPAAWTFGISGEVPLADVQKLHREIVHVRCEDFYALRQQVVEPYRRNRRGQAGGRRHERFRDPGRADPEVRRAGLTDAFEGCHDAPDRTEQPDEGRHARGCCKEGDVLFQLVDLHDRRAEQGPVDGRKALQGWTTGNRLRIG